MSQIEVLEPQQDIRRYNGLFPSIDSTVQTIPLFDLQVDRTAPTDEITTISFDLTFQGGDDLIAVTP